MTVGVMILGLVIAVVSIIAAIAAGTEGSKKAAVIVISFGLPFSVAVATFGALYGPVYNVWYQQMNGKAKLREAEQSRQIKIEEARAKLESSKLDALSEIERAKGLAAANDIVIKSLGSPQAYLRWKWIEEVAGSKNQVIYVPTETNLPVLEAGKRQ